MYVAKFFAKSGTVKPLGTFDADGECSHRTWTAMAVCMHCPLLRPGGGGGGMSLKYAATFPEELDCRGWEPAHIAACVAPTIPSSATIEHQPLQHERFHPFGC